MWDQKQKKAQDGQFNYEELHKRVCSLEKKLYQLGNAAQLQVKEERYMDVASACEFLGTGRTSLYELMKSGKLAYTYIGKQRRILISDLKKYVLHNYVPTRASIL